MSGSLDTNVLLRLILNDVPEQYLVIKKLLASGSNFTVADAALFEMIYVLEKVYRQPREQVAKNVRGIIRNEQFICNKKLLEGTIDLYQNETKLSIIDCALTRYAELDNCLPLFTFDIALTKACPESTKIPA
jgi:predicted nucleic-acid-binding protein